MKRTISFMTGKGSVNHNSRKFHAKNTDPERSCLNVEYCNENVKDVYHELFDEALTRYNEKQTRSESDRRIDDYYEKIRSGKQEKPFHEIILQIGDKDNMGAKTENGRLAAKVLDKYMRDFQRRNPTLRVFSAYLHMDEATPHLHIDFVPYTTGSRRGIDTRVSLKQAVSALGFKGGTRRETELNQWVAYEKEQLAAVMLEHGIEWEKKGTHEKHLSVLDFEKQERAKEVAELEQSISDGKERLSDIQIQHRKAVQETEQIRQKGEAIRQEVSELSEISDLLKEQATTLAEDKKKLLSDNVKLEKQQKKLQQDIEKMVQSKAVMERNIHAYDEDEKWQLPEPAALVSAKAYKDKKAFPLVEKLKETIKALTIKCVQLAEQGKKLKEKVTRQEQQISRLTDKVMEQSDIIDRLQEKTEDLGRLERYFGREQVQSIVERSKALEWAEKENKRPKRVFDMSR
ncbi:plasmid recombination protein [Mediterraneibacter gnavus]